MRTKAAGATRDEEHSLAPIQLEAMSRGRDLASIKRQARRLALALLGSLLAMAGLLLWMNTSDSRSEYAAAAKQLDSLYAQQAATFADCTLLQQSNTSQEVMRTAIEAASQHSGKAYDKQLAPCTRALGNLERQLGELDIPISMEHRVEGLRHATAALNRAIGRYRSYLVDPNRAYDFTTATPQIDSVVVAWSNYDVQRQTTLDVLRVAAQPRSAK